MPAYTPKPAGWLAEILYKAFAAAALETVQEKQNHSRARPAPTMSTMKILCLHGIGTSAKIFEAQTSRVIAKLKSEGHEFVFVDGLYEFEAADGTVTLSLGRTARSMMKTNSEPVLQTYEWSIRHHTSLGSSRPPQTTSPRH